MSTKAVKGYVELKDPKYQEWIDEFVPDDAKQACKGMSVAMAKRFPELRVVGISNCLQAHAWCVNKDDKVVDPTSHQFSGKFDYSVPTLELADFPIGKCHWCGEPIWPDTDGARKYNTDWDSVGPHVECEEAFRKEYEKDEHC